MNNLEQVLVTHLNAVKYPINALPASSCPSTFEVFDFDAIKDEFCNNFLIPNHAKLCSADCLHLDISKKLICFMEMKNFSAFLSTNHTNFPNFSDFQKELSAWLEKTINGLRLKIADSLLIIISALGNYSPATTDISEILDKNNVEVRYIILFNTDSREYLQYGLATLNRKLSHGLLSGRLCRAIIIQSSVFDTYAITELQ